MIRGDLQMRHRNLQKLMKIATTKRGLIIANSAKKARAFGGGKN